MTAARRDQGYATIAAVAAIAAFAYIAFELLAANTTALVGVRAQADRARLLAAADAGLATAIHGLGVEDRTVRWPIDGAPRRLSFDGRAVSVTVEDERGKIPLNDIDDDQARRMFAAAGAEGDQLEAVTDAFLDWRDPDNVPRVHGAEADDYAAAGVRPRNGDLPSVADLRRIKGVTAALYGRIAPAATVHFGVSGGFSKDTAQPLALSVMSEVSENSPDLIERQRERDGQRVALDIADDVRVIGRPLTVRAEASDGRGGRAVRSAIIQITGDAAAPYQVLSLN